MKKVEELVEEKGQQLIRMCEFIANVSACVPGSGLFVFSSCSMVIWWLPYVVGVL